MIHRAEWRVVGDAARAWTQRRLARLSEGWCPNNAHGRLSADGRCDTCGWWYRTDGIGECMDTNGPVDCSTHAHR